MRIVQLDPLSFTPPYDHHLSSALGALDHDVHLLASRFLFGPVPEADTYTRDEVFLPISGRVLGKMPRSPLRLPLKAFEYPVGQWRVGRILDRVRPDVVHFQWIPWPKVDVRWLRRLQRRVPLVLTAHDVIPRRSEHQLELWKQIFATMDHVIVHSTRAVEQLVDFGVAEEKLSAIPHPLFARTAAEPPTPPSGQTMLFFGLLRTYKGLDLLIEALPAILRELPQARLIVAGDPLDPVDALQARATELGVADAIDWRLGFVPDDAIDPLMAQASAVVLPYRKIDSSGVLATALGHGRPAIVTDVGSLGDIVGGYGAGEVVPPLAVDDLAQACVRLLGNPEQLHSAYEGTLRAASALTWETSARRHLEVYARLTGLNV